MNSEMSHLKHLVTMSPRTASGRVRVAWAVIRADLAMGKTLREVWEAAEQDGLGVPYAHFKTYVHRLRKRDRQCSLRPAILSRARTATPEVEPPLEPLTSPAPPSHEVVSDPLRNVRELRAKKVSFEFDPFPARGLTQ